MLPLLSIITIVVMGVGLFSKMLTVCSFPLSRISKSSCTRSGTSRRCWSVTVTYTGTDAVETLNFC